MLIYDIIYRFHHIIKRLFNYVIIKKDIVSERHHILPNFSYWFHPFLGTLPRVKHEESSDSQIDKIIK